MSASDYPEHLNPFSEDEKKKSGLHLSRSLKDFKRTIRHSFRIKKKEKPEDVQLRKKEPFFPPETPILRTRVASHEFATSTPALPRSRFRERLAKSYNPEMNGSAIQNTSNPFEDSEDNSEAPRVRVPRRKKRAPLPPKSSSSQSVNDRPLGEKHDSKWSLTSYETDVSTENLSDVCCSRELDISEELESFNKEMQKLNEEPELNDNKDRREQNDDAAKTIDYKLNIPDVVVSCADENDGGTDHNSEDKKDTEGSPNKCDQENNETDVSVGVDKGKDANSNNQSKDELPDNQDFDGEVLERNVTDKTEKNIDETNVKENIEVKEKHYDKVTEEKEQNRKVEEESKRLSLESGKLENVSCSSNESLMVVDITPNLKNIQEVENVYVESKVDGVENVGDLRNNVGEVEIINQEESPISFNQQKSIFITGSRDELNNKNGMYSERFSMFIKGSREELDKENNNKAIEDQNGMIIIHPKSDCDTPVPKQRKNKLSKHELLLG